MERSINATEARIYFGELMRRVVEHDEPVIVERGGKPEVVMISFAEYKRLHANHANDWLERVDKVREQIRRELGGRTLPPSEEIIREMREERDVQILENLR